jgi:hypothetical protein
MYRPEPWFFYNLILLEKNARPVCETRRPKKKNNASEIRVWVHLYPWAENGGHVAAENGGHVAECWEPIGFMKCFTAEFQRDAMAKVIADTSWRLQ